MAAVPTVLVAVPGFDASAKTTVPSRVEVAVDTHRSVQGALIDEIPHLAVRPVNRLAQDSRIRVGDARDVASTPGSCLDRSEQQSTDGEAKGGAQVAAGWTGRGTPDIGKRMHEDHRPAI